MFPYIATCNSKIHPSTCRAFQFPTNTLIGLVGWTSNCRNWEMCAYIKLSSLPPSNKILIGCPLMFSVNLKVPDREELFMAKSDTFEICSYLLGWPSNSSR